MLEIYKEILYDSLNMDGKVELKIKETPKGIIVNVFIYFFYVQIIYFFNKKGLTKKKATNEEDLIEIIEFGYNTR